MIFKSHNCHVYHSSDYEKCEDSDKEDADALTFAARFTDGVRPGL